MTTIPVVILTPVGVVEIGDIVTIDLSNDPVARNYRWPQTVRGKAFEAHDGVIHVSVDAPVPRHLKTPMPPSGFAWRLSSDNVSQVIAITKAVRP